MPVVLPRGLTPALSRRFRAPRCLNHARDHLCPLVRPTAGGDCGGAHFGSARGRSAQGADRQDSRSAKGCAWPHPRARDNEIIDQALALWFPAPHSETGEDIAELQLHGGRAVVAAVLARALRLAGLASGGGRRIHPSRFRKRQARSYGGGRPCRPGDGGDGRPAPSGLPADDRARWAIAPKTGARS